MRRELTPRERFISKALGRQVRLKGGISLTPTVYSQREATRVAIPARNWEYGICRKVLAYEEGGNEAFLFVKKPAERR